MIKNIMKIGFGTLLLFATTATAFSFCANDGKKEITPDEKQIEVCRQLVGLISNYNYKKVPLNDSLSNVVFDAYLKSIDASKIYYFENEVNNFLRERNNYDDFLMEGNLIQPYAMFNIYMERYTNRMNFILAKLETEKFEFTSDESIIFDRENANWFKSQAESDEYWTKRLRYDLLNLKLAGSDEAKSKETLKKRYQNLISQADKVNSYDAFQAIMTAYTESVDPHTNYFNPSNAANFNIDMSRSLEGIGATLRMDNDFVTINAITPGGPADKSGLVSVDDKFIAVAQGKDGEFTDIVGWRLDNAIQLIRGAKGTTVRLKVVSKGQDVATPKIVEIVRDKIILQDQSAKKEIRQVTQNGKTYRVGVIDIPAFYMDFRAYQSGDKNYKSTTRDVRLILDSLKNEKVDAVIVDLRSNGGGSLVEAIDLTGLFIKSGPVVQVRDTKNNIDVGEDKNSDITWEGPLAVMIDRFSASASEIFAGAIQDYGRGVIIGTQSYGKGTVQNAIDLDQVITNTTNKVVGKENTYGQINLTVAKFYRVNGSSTQNKGVTPDINFPMIYPADKYGESSEKSALPWDEIKKSNYKPVAVLNTTIKPLIEKHDKRMKTNKEFAYLLEDIKQFKDREENKPVSLNEEKMKRERDENDQKNLDRENERRIARGLAPLKKGEVKPKGEKPFDFMLEEGCAIVADWLTIK